MKKVLGIVMAAALLFSLAACSSEVITTTAPQTSAAATEKEAAPADALSFLKDGEIYFDIHLGADVIKNLSISVDGKTLGSDKKLTFKEGSSYDITGEGKADAKIILIIVSASKDGDHYRAIHDFSSGNADEMVSLISLRLSRTKGDKICVVLTENKNDWDHNLGEAFNKLMETAFPFAP